MALTDQEMGTALGLVLRMSTEQLAALQTSVGTRREQLNRTMVATLRPGVRVRWKGKAGEQTGVVQKVKTKWVEVRPDQPILGKPGGFWNVHAGLLEVLP